jgi:hypothetical protein
MFKNRNFISLNKHFDVAEVPVTLRVTGNAARGDFDTYLVTGPITNAKTIFEPATASFQSVADTETDNLLLPRAKEYIKVGSKAGDNGSTRYRGLLQYNLASDFAAAVGDRSYVVQRAVLTLTPKDGIPVSGTVEAQLTGQEMVSDAATWDSPDPKNNKSWDGSSGGVLFRSTATYPWYIPGWSGNDPLVFPNPDAGHIFGNSDCGYIRPGALPGDIQNPNIDIPGDLKHRRIPIHEPPIGISSDIGPEYPIFVPIKPIGINPQENGAGEELYYWQGVYWRRTVAPNGRYIWQFAIPMGKDRKPGWVIFHPCLGVEFCLEYSPDGGIKYRPVISPQYSGNPWDPFNPPGNDGLPPEYIAPPADYPYTVQSEEEDTGLGRQERKYLINPRIGDGELGYPTPNPYGSNPPEDWHYEHPPCRFTDPNEPYFPGPGWEGSDYPYPPGGTAGPKPIPAEAESVLEQMSRCLGRNDIGDTTTFDDNAFTFLDSRKSAELVTTASKVKLDITSAVSEWSRNPQQPLSLLVYSPSNEQQDKVFEFESLESVAVPIGDAVFTTCTFLSAGDTTTVHTKGAASVLEANGSNILVTVVDNDPVSAQNFASFQNIVSVGATFDLIDSDINNGVNLGTTTCTVLARPASNSVLISGLVLPNGLTSHEATLEFVATVTVPAEVYILDIANPSSTTLKAFEELNTNDGLGIRYLSGAANNNSKDFTLKLVSDDTLYNSRLRIFFNESVVSESRTGKPTQIIQSGIKPTLEIDLILR